MSGAGKTCRSVAFATGQDHRWPPVRLSANMARRGGCINPISPGGQARRARWPGPDGAPLSAGAAGNRAPPVACGVRTALRSTRSGRPATPARISPSTTRDTDLPGRPGQRSPCTRARAAGLTTKALGLAAIPCRPRSRPAASTCIEGQGCRFAVFELPTAGGRRRCRT